MVSTPQEVVSVSHVIQIYFPLSLCILYVYIYPHEYFPLITVPNVNPLPSPFYVACP